MSEGSLVALPVGEKDAASERCEERVPQRDATGDPVSGEIVAVDEDVGDRDTRPLREALAHELALGGAEEEADAEGSAERSALALAQPEADDGGVALLFAVAGGESEAAPDSVALPLPQPERPPPGKVNIPSHTLDVWLVSQTYEW